MLLQDGFLEALLYGHIPHGYPRQRTRLYHVPAIRTLFYAIS